MRKYVAGGVFLCLSVGVMAQEESSEGLKYCGSTEQREALFQMYEPYRVQDSIDQTEFQVYYDNFLNQQTNGAESSALYTIPVVVHVVHLNGVENISDEQIYDAIEVLNQDFNKENSDTSQIVSAFTGIAGNAQIEFKLASKDPNGDCHKGITRTYSTNTYDTGMNFGGHPIVDDVKAEHGTWPQNQYMNIFVCIDPDGAAGYTLTPSNWLPETDMYGGILLRHDYMGSIGTSNIGRSRTLTHEVGHWLNLSHTWGPNNSPGNAGSCSDDDGVGDTPNTIGWTSCTLNGTTCSSLDNVQNYMEYSYCSRMFTNGQVTRMHAALNSGTAGRNDLWKTSNLIATGTLNAPGVCKADFESSQMVFCAGTTIDFEDLSFHNVSSWNWTINGGTPSSSTLENPTGIVFNTPGTYDISLTVSDGSSTTTTTKPSFITVLPTDAIPVPYSEGFESISAVPSYEFGLENQDGGTSWQITSLASNLGSKSIFVNNTPINQGNFDSFISNTMDLTGSSSVVLSFDYAFAQRDNQDMDALKIYVSNDCGETWSLRKNLVGSNLATRTPTNGTFIPNPAEWFHVDVTNILASYFVEGFRFKFEFESDGGNRIFVDNINIDGVLGVPLYTGEDINLSVYPNPTQEAATIAFNSFGNNVKVMATDLTGRVVETIFTGKANGATNLYWNTSSIASGTYILIVDLDGQRASRKVVVE